MKIVSSFVAVDRDIVSAEFRQHSSAFSAYLIRERPRGVFEVKRKGDKIVSIQAVNINASKHIVDTIGKPKSELKVVEDSLVREWYPRHLINY